MYSSILSEFASIFLSALAADVECNPHWSRLWSQQFHFSSIFLSALLPTYFRTQKFLPDQHRNWNFLIEKMDSFNLLSKFPRCKKLFSQFFSDCLARCPSRVGWTLAFRPSPPFITRSKRPPWNLTVSILPEIELRNFEHTKVTFNLTRDYSLLSWFFFSETEYLELYVNMSTSSMGDENLKEDCKASFFSRWSRFHRHQRESHKVARRDSLRGRRKCSRQVHCIRAPTAALIMHFDIF